MCEDHNKDALFTRATAGQIQSPGGGGGSGSADSRRACLCSHFNLWAPEELLEDFDVLSK